MKVRIKQGMFYGAFKQYREGDELEVSAEEFSSFGDKFEIVRDKPLDAKVDSSLASREEFAARVTFDASSMTINEVLQEVESGRVSAEVALESELAGNSRKTLVSRLKAMSDSNGNSGND